MSLLPRLVAGIVLVHSAPVPCAVAAERVADFPWKPVRIVVPFAPGGGADLNARLIGPRLAEKFGQPVVTDNRPAANGIVGGDIVAKAAPDGHTVLLATSNFAANPAMYQKLPFDIVRDFSPITLTFNSPLVVVVHPSVPAKSIQELIAYARANPNKLNYGSSGAGGPPHLAGELLKAMAKVDIAHISYKGIGPVLTALLGNEVQLTFSNTFVVQQHMKAGRMRALAITSLQRSQAAPDLPTLAESGLSGYEAGIWYGVMAPAATPKAVVSRLNNEIVAILRLPDVSQSILAQGGEVVASTPEAFARILREDIVRLAKVIGEAGIKPE
ncbi:MAG TPA: tripartite tricarboxylate transporter substrate binding protein [Burkholderiales bacterium]|jgi:tripartite-type tricarboxylate transporter receptor subunit TctC